MADYEGLHGQILCFCGVTPLAGSGANNTQRFEQGARRNVAATHLAELSRFWCQDILRQNLKVHSQQSETKNLVLLNGWATAVSWFNQWSTAN